MEHLLKMFSENCKKIWDERSLILIHRPIFAAFGFVVFAVATAVSAGGMWFWASSTITSRENEIRIKDATI
jgi:hypothetical protein